MSSNPYAAPKAAVSDIEDEQEYQEIRMWSAEGRIGRLRYLAYFTGSMLLAGAVAALLGAVLDPALAGVLALALYVAVTGYSIITAIKRSHDMNWSGWSVLLAMIPPLGLVWMFKSGTRGTNNYGAPPPPNTPGVRILGLLLPAVFILGVLAAIAIPAYVDYQKRAAAVEQPQ